MRNKEFASNAFTYGCCKTNLLRKSVDFRKCELGIRHDNERTNVLRTEQIVISFPFERFFFV